MEISYTATTVGQNRWTMNFSPALSGILGYIREPGTLICKIGLQMKALGQ